MPGLQAISTRVGARPQAILHPSGNRGADLVETIRLERMSADLMEKGPHPDMKLFIPAHHTDPGMRRRPTRPGVGPPGAQAWKEPRWNRPQTAGAIRVEDRAALDEFLSSDTPASDGFASQNGSRLASPLPPGAPGSPGTERGAGTSIAASSVTGSVVAGKSHASQRRRPHSAATIAEMRVRARLQQEQQQNHERVMRKLREAQAAAAAAQEEEFKNAWEQFNSEQNGAVADIEKMLRLQDVEFVRRATAHAKNWNEEVFERIQDQITKNLRRREADGSYNTRWRHAQDDYLRTLEKKDAGIFRDIVIEAEYDPLEVSHNTVKYSSKKVNLRDPLKLELRKHEQESRMVPGSAADRMAPKKGQQLCRECFDVKMWPHLEATPFGHFNKIEPRKPSDGPYKSVTGERVLGNHYIQRPKTVPGGRRK